MQWLDYAHTGNPLLFQDLVPQRLHSRPMNFGTEMMFGVIAVKKPDPIVELVVTAHALCHGFVRIAAVMTIVPVEIGKAVTEIPERKKKTDVGPVENSENDEVGNEKRQFRHSPKSLAPTFPFQLAVSGLRVFPEKAEERVTQRGFGLAIVSMFVDRDPIDHVSAFVGPICVALVVLHVNALVKNLAETHGHRFKNAE